MFRKRTETMTISEFMERQEKPCHLKSNALKIATGATVPFMLAQPAFASEGGGAIPAAAATELGMDQLHQVLEALVEKAFIVAEEFLWFSAKISVPGIFVILPIAWLISLFGMRDFGKRVFRTSGISFVALQLLPIAYGIVTGGAL